MILGVHYDVFGRTNVGIFKICPRVPKLSKCLKVTLQTHDLEMLLLLTMSSVGRWEARIPIGVSCSFSNLFHTSLT